MGKTIFTHHEGNTAELSDFGHNLRDFGGDHLTLRNFYMKKELYYYETLLFFLICKDDIGNQDGKRGKTSILLYGTRKI